VDVLRREPARRAHPVGAGERGGDRGGVGGRDLAGLLRARQDVGEPSGERRLALERGSRSSAISTGNVSLPSRRSASASLPVTAGSPAKSRQSSIVWNATPSATPNRSSAPATASSSPPANAPARIAHRNSDAVLPSTTRSQLARSMPSIRPRRSSWIDSAMIISSITASIGSTSSGCAPPIRRSASTRSQSPAKIDAALP
jgi:hypothetical protein